MTAFFGLYAPGERGTTLDKAREHLEEVVRFPNTFLRYTTTQDAIRALLDDHKAKTEALKDIKRMADEGLDSGAIVLIRRAEDIADRALLALLGKEHDHEG